MLIGVLDLYRRCFEFVLNSYKMIPLTESVSAWDFLLLCFVSGGIITVIIRQFGANGISNGGVAVVNRERSSSNNKKE